MDHSVLLTIIFSLLGGVTTIISYYAAYVVKSLKKEIAIQWEKIDKNAEDIQKITNNFAYLSGKCDERHKR